MHRRLPVVPAACVMALVLGGAPAGPEDILGDAAGLFGTAAEVEGPQPMPISGYVEAAARAYQQDGDPVDWRAQSAGKVKVRLQTEGAGIRVRAEINALFSRGYGQESVGELVPRDLRPALEPFLAAAEDPYADRIEVAQAYVELPIGPLTLAAGRQPLALGTGYAWNPVDPFSGKSSLDPTYEVPAHDAVRLAAPLPRNGEARMAVIAGPAPGRLQELSGFAAVRVNLLFDWELSAATRYGSWTTDSLAVEAGRENVYGLATAGQVRDVGLHGELAWVDWPQGRGTDHLRGLAGLDTTLDSGKVLLLEYRYDGAGGTGDYKAAEWLAALSGERSGLARNAIYASATQTVMDVAEISLAAVVNLDDTSAALVPQVSVNFSERAESRLTMAVPLGRDGSEHGTGPVAVEARLTAYY